MQSVRALESFQSGPDRLLPGFDAFPGPVKLEQGDILQIGADQQIGRGAVDAHLRYPILHNCDALGKNTKDTRRLAHRSSVIPVIRAVLSLPDLTEAIFNPFRVEVVEKAGNRLLFFVRWR